MLHLIPKPLHRLAYRLAHAMRRVWWRIARPRVSGCRVLAFDGEGRVLLVRHSYGSGNWMAPGGGLKRGEDALLTGPRELQEETGCALEGVWRVALVEEPLKGATNVVHVLAGQAVGAPMPDGREVIEAAFFSPEALPIRMSALLKRDLPGWLRAAKAGRPTPDPQAPSPLP
ncbi:MAG TPA: NUDIX domain-containing protein [Novosphingobium sp.]